MFVCPVHSKPNTETPRFAAEKMFIQEAAKLGDWENKSLVHLPEDRV